MANILNPSRRRASRCFRSVPARLKDVQTVRRRDRSSGNKIRSGKRREEEAKDRERYLYLCYKVNNVIPKSSLVSYLTMIQGLVVASLQ